MRLRFVFPLLAALSFATHADADVSVRPPFPPAQMVRLANGLTVLLAPDPNARLVSIDVSYRVGSADDPNGRQGLAHLVEHMTMLRTAHVEHPARYLESLGAIRFNATTSYDATDYFESVPPERLENVLWLASDQMGFAVHALTTSALKLEREVVRNEDIGKMKDSMSAVRRSAMHALFPAWHPYASTADGAVGLDAIDPDDIRAFRAAWYTPRNATLAIAGRFEPDAALALVKHYFESLPSPEPPTRPALPEWEAAGVELGMAAPVPAPAVSIVFRTPSFGQPDDAALDFAATILTGRGNTRMQRTLVASGLVTSVQARQGSWVEASVFEIGAVVAPGATTKAVAEEILRDIDDLSRTVTDAEVERARAIWRDGILTSLETSWGRASRLTTLARIGWRPRAEGGAFEWDMTRYESVTRANVMAAVARWLLPSARVVVSVIPMSSAPLAGVVLSRSRVSP